jgi:putative sterol carrier protein
MDIPENVGVKEYFDEYVPKVFAEQIGGGAVLGMEGTEIKVQFDITGGPTYSLVVKDAKELEVKEGPVDNPTVTLAMSEDVFRRAVTGKLQGATDTFTDVSKMSRNRFDQLLGIKGKMDLDLAAPDGSNAEITVKFNGVDSPASIFRCSVEDWVAMNNGQLAGPTAFMSGKLKIEGDMAFAMSLSSLVS